MKETLNIYKIGGGIINEPSLLNAFLKSISTVTGRKLIVHGGGKKATELSQKMQLETKMIAGRRITDAPTLELVTMVYAGLINKNIVSKLRSVGITALGMCGADLGIITATKRVHPTLDYGFVGDITDINSAALSQLLGLGYTPVICAISDNAAGQLLNTNADTIATYIACAMNADYEVSLHFVFEFDGVMKDIKDDSSLISTLAVNEISDLNDKGIISGGMLPKILATIHAKEAGVPMVRICSVKNIHNNIGTTITI